jgi:hypothetical protein
VTLYVGDLRTVQLLNVFSLGVYKLAQDIFVKCIALRAQKQEIKVHMAAYIDILQLFYPMQIVIRAERVTSEHNLYLIIIFGILGML